MYSETGFRSESETPKNSSQYRNCNQQTYPHFIISIKLYFIIQRVKSRSWNSNFPFRSAVDKKKFNLLYTSTQGKKNFGSRSSMCLGEGLRSWQLELLELGWPNWVKGRAWDPGSWSCWSWADLPGSRREPEILTAGAVRAELTYLGPGESLRSWQLELLELSWPLSSLMSLRRSARQRRRDSRWGRSPTPPSEITGQIKNKVKPTFCLSRSIRLLPCENCRRPPGLRALLFLYGPAFDFHFLFAKRKKIKILLTEQDILMDPISLINCHLCTVQEFTKSNSFQTIVTILIPVKN